jgi:hypothetical protein
MRAVISDSGMGVSWCLVVKGVVKVIVIGRLSPCKEAVVGVEVC